MDTLVQSKASIKTPAYAARDAKTPLAPWLIARREPGPHDVLIDILYLRRLPFRHPPGARRMGRLDLPMVPGHEIVGRVAKVGDDVKKWKPGHIVGVAASSILVGAARPTARARSNIARQE